MKIESTKVQTKERRTKKNGKIIFRLHSQVVRLRPQGVTVRAQVGMVRLRSVDNSGKQYDIALPLTYDENKRSVDHETPRRCSTLVEPG